MPLYKTTEKRLAKRAREDEDGMTELKAAMGMASGSDSDSDESASSDDGEDSPSEDGEASCLILCFAELTHCGVGRRQCGS